MADESKDTGVMLALLERFETQRFPRALAIQARIDKGERLTDTDIEFLDRVFKDAQYVKPLAEKHPKWLPLVTRALNLYKDIMNRALENEKAGNTAPR